jgi:hypothetical protein
MWNFTAVMSHDSWCGGNTPTALAVDPLQKKIAKKDCSITAVHCCITENTVTKILFFTAVI